MNRMASLCPLSPDQRRKWASPRTAWDTVLPIPTNVEVGGSIDVGDVSGTCQPWASWSQHISPHRQWGCVATNGMSVGRKAVIHAAHVLAATGLDLLTDPNQLSAAREDFAKRTAGKSDKSLNELKSPIGGTLDAEERHEYECCIDAAMEHFGIKEEVVR